MEHVHAVQARIATIRGLVESMRPDSGGAGRFHAALTDALAEPGAGASGSGVQKAAPGEPVMSAASLGAVRFVPAAHGASGGRLGMPVDARLSSRFGARVHPVTGQRHHHAGVDFAAPAGTPIRAAAGGTVAFAGVRGGYGNLVILEHGDGMQTWYAHQRDLAVREGERVPAGGIIGTVGSTGRSTGPHLHLEVRRDGVPVDPLPLLSPVGGIGGGHAAHR